MATPLSTSTLFDFLMIFCKFLELIFQTKAEQECTLTDGIHVSTYSMGTKFDILNHDGFLISRGWRFRYILAIAHAEILPNVLKPESNNTYKVW